MPPALAAAAERRARILHRAPPAAAAHVLPPRGQLIAHGGGPVLAQKSGFALHLRGRQGPAPERQGAAPDALAAQAGTRASLARGRPSAYASPYSRQALRQAAAPHGRVRR